MRVHTRNGRRGPTAQPSARAGSLQFPRLSATRLSTRSRRHPEVSRVTHCSTPGSLREKDPTEARGPSEGPGHRPEAGLSLPPRGHLAGSSGTERRAHRVRLARPKGRDDGGPKPVRRRPADVTDQGTETHTSLLDASVRSLPGPRLRPSRVPQGEDAVNWPLGRTCPAARTGQSPRPLTTDGAPWERARLPGALYVKRIRIMIQRITCTMKRA